MRTGGSDGSGRNGRSSVSNRLWRLPSRLRKGRWLSRAATRRWPRSAPLGRRTSAGAVLLPDHDVLLDPGSVQLAEPAVAIAVRARLPVLLPELLQSDVLVAPQFLLDGR